MRKTIWRKKKKELYRSAVALKLRPCDMGGVHITLRKWCIIVNDNNLQEVHALYCCNYRHHGRHLLIRPPISLLKHSW